MSGRVDAVLEVLRRVLAEPVGRLGAGLAIAASLLGRALFRLRWRLAALALFVACGIGLYKHPPLHHRRRGRGAGADERARRLRQRL